MPASDAKAPATRPELDPAPTTGHAVPPVHGSGQEVQHTASRRSQPRAWLRAVTWLLDHQIHPKAGPTTAAVAADLAARMDYLTGTVLYDLQGTADRLGVDRSTVKRHVKILRELGALAWTRHGTKKNLHLPGRPYTATATIYAAVIPSSYDDAVGHRIAGFGYHARVIGVTDAGRQLATAQARSSHPRRKSTTNTRAPQSLGSTCNQRSVQAEGGKEAKRQRSAPPTPRPAPPAAPRSTILGRTVTARAYQQAHHLARSLRPLHPWLQRASHGELSWVLLDKVLSGWTPGQVHSWISSVAPAIRHSSDWRPTRPHAYLAAQLRLDHDLSQRSRALTEARERAVPPNEAFQQAAAALGKPRIAPASDPDPQPDLHCADRLTPTQLTDLRQAAREELQLGSAALIASAVQWLGPHAAQRLYGPALLRQGLHVHCRTGADITSRH